MKSELTPEQAREKIYGGVCRDCGGELYHTRGGFNQDTCDNCHAAWTRDRREALDELVSKAMSEMTSEAAYWTLPIDNGNAILDELDVTVDGPSYAIGTAPKRALK